jgi:hypothetical protein
LAGIWARSAWAAQLAASAVLSVASALLLTRRHSSLLLLGLFLALSTYPLALVVWHGDAMEVPRHALPVALQLRFALICLLMGIFDVVFRQDVAHPDGAGRAERWIGVTALTPRDNP